MSLAALDPTGSGIIDPIGSIDEALASYRAAVLDHERVKVTAGAWPSDLTKARCEEVEAQIAVKRALGVLG